MNDARAGNFADVAFDEPYPGVIRRVLDGTKTTTTRYEFEPGASFPLHRHPQEQITLVDVGSVRMTLGSAEEWLAAGGWSIVPGGLEHAITAGPEGASITAIIAPRRAAIDPYEEVCS